MQGRGLFLFIVLMHAAAFAAETWKVETLFLDGTPSPKEGKIELRWEGELINDTTQDVTLHAVLELLDENGATIRELETSAVNVPRFGKQELKERFLVTADEWEKTKSMAQWGEPSAKRPVNGDRIRVIELYGVTWCKYCTKARDYLISEGVSFTEYEVDLDKEAKGRFMAMGGGGVPLLVIDGKPEIRGWSENNYRSILFPAKPEEKIEKPKRTRTQPIK